MSAAPEFMSKVLPEGVTAEQFVREWQTAPHVGAAARALGMDPGLVRQYAGFLRKKGVPLKKMITRNRGVDYDALADLAKSLLP